MSSVFLQSTMFQVMAVEDVACKTTNHSFFTERGMITYAYLLNDSLFPKLQFD